MCGRINISKHPVAVLFMELAGQPFPVEDRFNLAPTEPLPIVRTTRDGERGVAVVRWWLTPYWSREAATKYSMFNAKAESLADSRAFGEPYERRRCVIPITGFYEWLRQGGEKQAQYIRSEADDGLLLAGVWDRWRGKDKTGKDTTVESCAVITVAVNERLAFIHNRQPLMLARESVDEWLDPATPREKRDALLVSRLPVALAVIPVSPYVNTSRNQGPRCIEPVGVPVVVPAG